MNQKPIRTTSNFIYKSINFDSFSCPLHVQTYHVKLSTCDIGGYALDNRFALSCIHKKQNCLQSPSDHVVFISRFLQLKAILYFGHV